MDNKEIELKFGFDGKASNLHSIFKKIGTVSNETVLHLDNTYFDTDEKELFAIRAGLRIRKADNFCEQTLKVKGENLGGLHKRTEYNVPIDKNETVPNLLKFPREALPSSYSLENMQERLKQVCKINFTRNVFNLEILDSVFEVACDNGYILVNDNEKYPLSELEIELKETSVGSDDLMNLFSILCTHLASNDLPLLLEPFSKMHRATLLQKNTKPYIDVSPLSRDMPIVDYVNSLVAMFETTYGYFLISHDAALAVQLSALLDTLTSALKQINRRSPLAFITGRKEPVEYKDDLKIIINLIKSFNKVLKRVSKKMLVLRLKGNQKGVENCFNKIRNAEKSCKMFLIPLKLRQLLSLIVK